HCLQLLHIRFGPLAANDLLCFSHLYSGFCKAGLVRQDNGNRMTKRCAYEIKLESYEAFTHLPMRPHGRRRHALCLPTKPETPIFLIATRESVRKRRTLISVAAETTIAT